MTQRDNRFWSQSDTFLAGYQDNRKEGFSYDAAGNLLADADVTYSYDAAGRNVSMFSAASNNRTIAVVYDGNGAVIKRTEAQQNTQTSVAYYVRSSVLGGRIVAELNQSGQKQKGYVFVNGQLLAEQSNNWVTWHHDNPLTGSQGISGSNGGFDAQAEPDPMGINVGFHDPYINCCVGPPLDDQNMPALLGSFSAGKCKSDGISIDCAWAMEMLANGSGVQCPNNDCGPRTVTVDIRYNGQRYNSSGLSSPFTAFFNGETGFVLGGIVRQEGIIARFSGAPAKAAAEAFFSGNSNFGSTLNDAIDAGNKSENSGDQEFAHARPVPCPPTGKTLAANSTVKATIKEASQKADEFRNSHGYWIEHGGWIYANLRTGRIVTYIKEPATSPPFQKNYPFLDNAVGVYLDNPPPAPKGFEIVGKFHVHVENDWNPETDGAAADRNKVPGLVGTPNGTIYVGGSYQRGIWNRDLPSRCR